MLAYAKYMEANMDAYEGMWLTKLLAQLFDCEIESIVVHYDNQSGIRIFDNLVFHDQTKHIDIKYHFLRDYVQRGTIWLDYIQKYDQVAEIFTKALCRQSFVKFKDKLGLLPNPFLVEREC